MTEASYVFEHPVSMISSSQNFEWKTGVTIISEIEGSLSFPPNRQEHLLQRRCGRTEFSLALAAQWLQWSTLEY